MGQLLAAQGPEAAADALAAGVARMEPGLGGSVLEKAGFAGPGAYELFSQGAQGLAAERQRYYQFGGAPLTQKEAETIKRGSDVVEGAWSGALSNFAKGVGMGATGVERLVEAIRNNTRATEDNTRSGTRIGP